MSKTIEIKDREKLEGVLRIFSALDDARWSDAGNYNLINYCEDDFTPDEKLLTHWLCYITDRQTPFQRIWDVGGYVISHLVRDFTTRRTASDRTILDEHMRFPSAEGGLRLECPLVRANSRLTFYKFDGSDSDPVEFTSRYMPADMVSICRTLISLDTLAERSFTQFIYKAVNGETDQRRAVRNMAAALHLLTYADIGNVNEDSVQERMTVLRRSLGKELSALSREPKEFIPSLSEEFERNPFKKKRLWCSIRDYLKSPAFNNYLVEALEKIDRNEAVRWRRENVQKEALAEMELPGDVWNNNRIFRDGLFPAQLCLIPESWDMPRTIREIYNIQKTEGQDANFYPEQLDVTFDFVPRMCGKLKCQFCMFGGGIEKQCHNQRGLYCPVTLAACGYFYPCNPDNCAFKSDSVRRFCGSSIAKGGV